jgi:hypothetical protein
MKRSNTAILRISDKTRDNTKDKIIEKSKEELISILSKQNIIQYKHTLINELKESIKNHKLQYKTFKELSNKYEPELSSTKQLEQKYKYFIKCKRMYLNNIMNLIPMKSNYTKCKESIKVKIYTSLLSFFIFRSTMGVLYGSFALVNTLYTQIYNIYYLSMIPDGIRSINNINKSYSEKDTKIINELKNEDDIVSKGKKKAIDTLYKTFILFFDYLYSMTESSIYKQVRDTINNVFENKYISYSKKLYFIVLMTDTKVDTFIKKSIEYMLCFAKLRNEDPLYDEKIKKLNNMKPPKCNTEFLEKVYKKIKIYSKKELKQNNGCPHLKNKFKCKKYPCITKCSQQYYGLVSSKKYCNINKDGSVMEVECDV